MALPCGAHFGGHFAIRLFAQRCPGSIITYLSIDKGAGTAGFSQCCEERSTLGRRQLKKVELPAGRRAERPCLRRPNFARLRRSGRP